MGRLFPSTGWATAWRWEEASSLLSVVFHLLFSQSGTACLPMCLPLYAAVQGRSSHHMEPEGSVRAWNSANTQHFSDTLLHSYTSLFPLGFKMTSWLWTQTEQFIYLCKAERWQTLCKMDTYVTACQNDLHWYLSALFSLLIITKSYSSPPSPPPPQDYIRNVLQDWSETCQLSELFYFFGLFWFFGTCHVWNLKHGSP